MMHGVSCKEIVFLRENLNNCFCATNEKIVGCKVRSLTVNIMLKTTEMLQKCEKRCSESFRKNSLTRELFTLKQKPTSGYDARKKEKLQAPDAQ